MKLQNYPACFLLLVVCTAGSFAQTCANKICGPYAAPMNACLSGTSTGTGCLTNNNVGFYTTTPGSGTYGSSFEGIDACTVSSSECEKNAPLNFDPNGGVGANQFLESVDIVTQAWDKTTGNGIFVSTKGGTIAAPQAVSSPFQPKLGAHCGRVGGNIVGMYDHVDNVWVLAFKTNWKDANNFTHYSFCIATSTQDNLEGTGGQSFWSAYDFVMDGVLPTDSKDSNNYYDPDYAKVGTWNDGNFYVTWDLLDPVTFAIDGSEVCTVDRSSIVGGNAANAMQCYVYWPAGQTNGTWNPASKPTLIHSLLPADIDSSNPSQQPPAGKSPWLVALVNPGNGSGGPCISGLCTSRQLAVWNWSTFTKLKAPVSLKVKPYTPGCYNTNNPVDTFCVPEPGGYKVDSLGDRVMHRFAYRNIAGQAGEILAVAHTINDPKSGLTDIRYYLIGVSGQTPTLVASGNLTSSSLNLFMPSATLDQNGDLALLYSTSANCSNSNCYPALNFDVVPYGQKADAPTLVIQGTAENQSSPGHWGEYFGVGTDPTDDLTFWGVGEYFDTNETNSSITWQSRIAKCQYGNGC